MIQGIGTEQLAHIKGRQIMDSMTRKSENKDFNEELSKQISKNENPLDQKLWDSCIEFESIFVKQMFNEMRKTVHKGEILNGGHAEEIFEDLLYDEYAKSVSKNSNLGIAKMLYSQLS
ncbi:MAG: rod-binding protein [Spirochaetes bacterium]|nr:rod-binding protein [Spirochaetota bacterium]MBN2770940.1 rod-binding protein [Spirochaetota bacterium]